MTLPAASHNLLGRAIKPTFTNMKRASELALLLYSKLIGRIEINEEEWSVVREGREECIVET